MARVLRRRPTDAEQKLWFELRDRRLRGFKFRRQMPKGNYVVDFVCEDRRLVIELDGGQHGDRKAADAERSAYLVAEGYRVLRFWNNEVTENVEGVLSVIVEALED